MAEDRIYVASQFNKGINLLQDSIMGEGGTLATLDNFIMQRDGSLKKRGGLEQISSFYYGNSFDGEDWISSINKIETSSGNFEYDKMTTLQAGESVFEGDPVIFVSGSGITIRDSSGSPAPVPIAALKFNTERKELSHITLGESNMGAGTYEGMGSGRRGVVGVSTVPTGHVVYRAEAPYIANTLDKLPKFGHITPKIDGTFYRYFKDTAVNQLTSRDWWGAEDDRLDEQGEAKEEVNVLLGAESEYNIENQGFSDGTVFKTPFESPNSVELNGRLAPVGAKTLRVGDLRHVGDEEGGYDQELRIRGAGCIYYGGRVFYWQRGTSVSNNDSFQPNFDTIVFYSRVCTTASDAPMCSPHENPVEGEPFGMPQEDDGGYFALPSAGGILAAKETGAGLALFTTTGIYIVSSQGGGFSPSTFFTYKASDLVIDNLNTLVEYDSNLMFFASDGIYLLTQNQQTGRANTQKFSHPIKEMYKEFPGQCITSFYNKKSTSVEWIFADLEGDMEKSVGTTGQAVGRWRHRVLCFDTDHGAFYTKTYDLLEGSYILSAFNDKENNPYYIVVSGAMDKTAGTVSGGLFSVVGVDTSDTNGDTMSVVEPSSGSTITAFTTKYEANTSTTPITLGDPVSWKGRPYLTTYVKNAEVYEGIGGPSSVKGSCQVATAFDYKTRSPKSKREIEAYRPRRLVGQQDTEGDYEKDLLITKTKILGRGKAVSLNVRAPRDNVCHLFGWALTLDLY